MTPTEQLTGAEDVAWDLSDLYAAPDDPKLEAEVAGAERAAAAFRERYHEGVVGLSATELAAAIAERERIESALDRALSYAQLRFTTNMADPTRGALVGKLQERAAAIETQLLFFTLELAALDDATADALLADPPLDHWRHWIASLRKYRPHLLTEPEERIMTEKSVSGSSSWARLFSELLSALRVTVDGGEEVGLETAMADLYSADGDTRRTAAGAITAALQPGLRTRTFVFNAILQDKSIDDRLRGYPTWISSRNLSNETTDDAVDALIEAVVSRYDVLRRYYRLKARLLGLDRIAFYDRFAPVSEGGERTTWAEARELTVGAYADFSPEVGEIIDGFFAKNWIDGPVRPDKSSGAFCATTIPGVHPYILTNFTGERRSVLTLAHELGHGLHGVLAQPLGLFNAACPLTTAETASVFGEALTFKRQLSTVEDPRERLDLLTGRLEDAFATTFRQISMNRFEDAAHTERRASGELAPERIGELWLESQTALFGDSVGTDGYESWWSYIPHFMSTPGYVYAYTYGYLFALTIFRRYEQEGDALVEPYLDLLRLGGSRSPIELAKVVGLDLTDPAIWSTGIDALADDVGEAERLAAEVGLL
jgi:oligoendopeptidase F